MLFGLRPGLLNVSVPTPKNNSASSNGTTKRIFTLLPQIPLRKSGERKEIPSHWFLFAAFALFSAISAVKIFPRSLSPNSFPRIDCRPPRRLGDPLTGLPGHLHHVHTSFEIFGQRLPHPLERFRILRGEHREANPCG